MSAWSEYKQKMGETRPWHVITEKKVNDNIAKQRLDICLSCDRLIKLTKQCRECGCIMSAKVTLEKAVCPLSKW